MTRPRERRTRAVGCGPGSQKDRRGGSIRQEPTATEAQPAATFPAEAFEVLRTGTLQIDGLAGLLADGLVNEGPVAAEVTVLALDRIGQRLAAALAAGGVS